jgi:hypothetical protein
VITGVVISMDSTTESLLEVEVILSISESIVSITFSTTDESTSVKSLTGVTDDCLLKRVAQLLNINIEINNKLAFIIPLLIYYKDIKSFLNK